MFTPDIFKAFVFIPHHANWNIPSPPPIPFPTTPQRAWRLACIREAEQATMLEDMKVALALAFAARSPKIVEIEGCRWRANPQGTLTYCGAVGR